MERVWKITEHTGELDVMEIVELVNSWKKFGRPQSLVDQNTKSIPKQQEVDPVDEAIGLLFGWLQQSLSLQIILMFIMSSILLSYVSMAMAPFINATDIWIFFLSFLPWMVVLCVAFLPLVTAFHLFPFKWDFLDASTRKVVELNLTRTNVILLFAVIVTPHISLTSTVGVIVTIVAFGFYLGVGFCSECIRLGLRGRAFQ